MTDATLKIWVLILEEEGSSTKTAFFREDRPPSSERVRQKLKSWGLGYPDPNDVAKVISSGGVWSQNWAYCALTLEEVE